MATTTKLDVMKCEIGADTISKRNGVYTARKEFFYTKGKTAADFVKRVTDAYPGAKILDSGEVWKPFKGGATTANSSHWFVKFTLSEGGDQ